MNKCIKLTILIILSLSVYFIYQKTKQSNQTILVLGDGLSQGIDSYGTHTYTYMDYFKDYYSKEKINIIKKYTRKDLTIKETLNTIKNDSSIKRDLREADLLIINLGLNDLLYKLALEENINNSTLKRLLTEISIDYQDLLFVINKFYKEKVIIIGYPQTYKEDYYLNKGIIHLNSILKHNNNKQYIYINTLELLNNRDKYFSNPNSFYPNQKAYQRIGKEILSKTLEK